MEKQTLMIRCVGSDGATPGFFDEKQEKIGRDEPQGADGIGPLPQVAAQWCIAV